MYTNTISKHDEDINKRSPINFKLFSLKITPSIAVIILIKKIILKFFISKSFKLFSIGYKMIFFSPISSVFLLRSSALQCKKAKIRNKNLYFSLQSKKFKPLLYVDKLRYVFHHQSLNFSLQTSH